MSILVFIDSAEKEIKKSSFEAITYAVELAGKKSTDCVAVLVGETNGDIAESVGKYGVKKLYHIGDASNYTSQAYASAIAQLTEKVSADVVVLPKSSLTDAVASRLAAKLKAAVAAGVSDLPDLSNGFKVKRPIYSGKAFAYVDLKGPKVVLTVAKNTIQPKEVGGKAEIENFNPSISESDKKVKVLDVEKATGDILLPEADIVVSGGRGMKGPENWGVLEDLAKALGAGTGCSKPVSDVGWRPHHEHIGQTGVKVSPNLYIALGISGAIQHLAGVNSSKVLVVINKDPEAPFFKAADYGIVGDIFEIVPKLTEAAKNI
jgi:electron transfer flavoprotein alpha subunit